MTKIRLYMDEDAMDSDLVHALRLRGVDVTTPEEEGTKGWKDKEQLDYATAQGRVMYTFNIADYCHIHAGYVNRGKNHAGIIVANQQRYDVGEQMRHLLRLIAKKSSDEMKNNIEFLSAWGK